MLDCRLLVTFSMTKIFYFLALNSGSVFAGNDLSVYPVTGIYEFVFRV